MTKTIKVELIDPIETHSGMVREIEFREPTGREYFAFGEPYQVVRMGDGGFVVVDKDEIILAYMEKCVRPPVDPIVLGTLSLGNATKVKRAFLDFFATAQAPISSAPATSSAST